MIDPVRQELLIQAHTVVVKVGTNVLTGGDGVLSRPLLALLEWGCLPIINENDTVSVAEIRFGDNDHLAAMVTNLLQAPLLILLTSADGLYPADPATDPGLKPLATVPQIDASILEMAG